MKNIFCTAVNANTFILIYMHALFISGPARSSVSDWEGNLAGIINCDGICPLYLDSGAEELYLE